jgi:hypothetical protein
VVLGGSIYYTWVKHQEAEAAKADEYEPLTMEELDLEIGKLEGVEPPEESLSDRPH